MKAVKRTQVEDFPKKKLQKPTYIPSIVPEDIRQAHHEVNCVLIGNTGVGKTTLLNELGEKMDQTDECLFDNFQARITSRRGEPVNVTFCECSALDEHSRLRSLTYQINQIFFLCFSTVDRNSFENAKLEWYPELDIIVPDAPIYLIGMQSDLRDQIMQTGSAALKKNIVTREEAEELVPHLGAIQYIETQIGNNAVMTKVMKQIAEVMLRELENQNVKASKWHSHLLPGSKNASCMSPKEKHHRDVHKSRKKESVMILSPRKQKSMKQLAKLNIRKSALPFAFHDIQPESSNQENMNVNVTLPAEQAKRNTKQTATKPTQRISLKNLRKNLFKIQLRKKQVVVATPKVPVARWTVVEPVKPCDSESSCEPIPEESKVVVVKETPCAIRLPSAVSLVLSEFDDEYDETGTEEDSEM